MKRPCPASIGLDTGDRISYPVKRQRRAGAFSLSILCRREYSRCPSSALYFFLSFLCRPISSCTLTPGFGSEPCFLVIPPPLLLLSLCPCVPRLHSSFPQNSVFCKPWRHSTDARQLLTNQDRLARPWMDGRCASARGQ